MSELKSKIYEKLSYTNQDYESILAEIIEMFKGSTSIDTRWDNISESDIMFIMMSLLAAHKDTLNYMVDYRILESFMSTAKERSSMTRIANSFGYKIQSYRAPYQKLKVVLESEEVAVIERFTSFIGSDSTTWVYTQPTIEGVTNDQKIEVYQGVPKTLSFSPGKIDISSMTHIITDEPVAIGNNVNFEGVSWLRIGNETWEEIQSIYTYTGNSQKVYELNVDPQGITYIRFLKNTDLSPYDGKNFTLKYILTSGQGISGGNNTEAILEVDGTEKAVEATYVDASFVKGSNPASTRDIKAGFNRYYASSRTLVTLEDYKNYILYNQKAVLGIDKCLVIDAQDNTVGGTGDGTKFGLQEPVEIALGIYVLKDNTPLEADERDKLISDINKLKVTGLTPYINGFKFGQTINPDKPEIEPVTIEIKINNLSFSTPVVEALKTMIKDYINSKGIGRSLTTSELYNLVLTSKFAPYFSADGIELQIFEDSSGTSVNAGKAYVADYHTYMNCSSVVEIS